MNQLDFEGCKAQCQGHSKVGRKKWEPISHIRLQVSEIEVMVRDMVKNEAKVVSWSNM